MEAEHALALAILADARRTFVDNVRDLTLEEALYAGKGHRSILGLMKHVAGWSAVYRSYAFDPSPRHWAETDWPRGLRDTIDPSEAYRDEILSWFERSYERWVSSLGDVEDLAEPRPVHWGATEPLSRIVVTVAGHWNYHAGEINALLAAARGEAWEWGEEVEENHISTAGHGIRPPWMTEAEADAYRRERGI